MPAWNAENKERWTVESFFFSMFLNPLRNPRQCKNELFIGLQLGLCDLLPSCVTPGGSPRATHLGTNYITTCSSPILTQLLLPFCMVITARWAFSSCSANFSVCQYLRNTLVFLKDWTKCRCITSWPTNSKRNYKKASGSWKTQFHGTHWTEEHSNPISPAFHTKD